MGAHRSVPLVLCLAAAGCGWRAPKPVPDPVIGEKARVTVKCPAPRRFDICAQRVGPLHSLTPDSIRLGRPDGTDVLAFAVDDVHLLEVSRAQQGNVAAGIGLGGAVGLLVGLVASIGACDDSGSSPCAPAGLAIGFFAGLGIGAAVGAGTRSDRWVPVRLAPPRQPADPE